MIVEKFCGFTNHARKFGKSGRISFLSCCQCRFASSSVEKKTEPPWNVLFFGSDSFSTTNLRALHRSRQLINRLEVVTKNPGKSVIGKFCHEEKLPVRRWPLDLEPDHGFDLGIVASFGHLLPAQLINSFPWGILNVHASLLPRWRGAAPVPRAILNGDTETGATIMRIHPKRFDVGEIVAQQSCPILPGETSESLLEKVAGVGAVLLVDVLSDIPGNFDRMKPQPTSGVTQAPKLSPQECFVDWTKSTQEIDRQFRAISYSFPLITRFHFFAKNVRLEEISLDSSTLLPNLQPTPGSFHYDKRKQVFRVRCGCGGAVVVSRLSFEGKKSLSAKEFYNGFVSKVGESERVFLPVEDV